MLAVEVAVFIDHFGFDPDTELESFSVYPVDQFLHLAAELLFIDVPVAESGIIIISLAEPAVIQDQHIHSERDCLLCQSEDIRSVKIHIERFPAVEKNRAHLIAPFSTAHMLSDAVLQVVGKRFKSGTGEAHDHFRRRELFTGSKRIGKLLLHKTQLHSGLVVLVFACVAAESAAVDKLHRVAAAGCLCCLFLGKDHHGVVLVRRCSSSAADVLLHMRHRCSLEISFHSVASVECDQVIIACQLVKACGHHFFYSDLFFCSIADQYASCDDVQLRDHAVKKRHLRHTGNILHDDLKRLRFLFGCIDSRESLQTVLAITYRIVVEPKVAGIDAVSILEDQRGTAHISCAGSRKFLREEIQRICAIFSRVVYIASITSVRIGQKVFHGTFCTASVIKMKEDTVTVRFHLISCVPGVYCK